MSRVVAIVHARQWSGRHPVDVLELLGDDTVLGWTLARLARAGRLDQVVVATSSSAADDGVAHHCRLRNIACYRGGEPDSLGRVHAAAECFRADIAVFVDGRQALVDPQFVDRVASEAVAEEADYVGYRYEDGRVAKGKWLTFFAEAVSRAALARADREVVGQRERQLVTPSVYSYPQWHRVRWLDVPSRLDDALLRQHDDAKSHLEVLSALVRDLGPAAIAATAVEIVDVCRRWPAFPAVTDALAPVS